MVIASSLTAQLSVTSPKSIRPSGVRMPRSGLQTTLSSVRSRCTACRGSSGASDAIVAHADAAASVTRSRFAGSG